MWRAVHQVIPKCYFERGEEVLNKDMKTHMFKDFHKTILTCVTKIKSDVDQAKLTFTKINNFDFDIMNQ